MNTVNRRTRRNRLMNLKHIKNIRYFKYLILGKIYKSLYKGLNFEKSVLSRLNNYFEYYIRFDTEYNINLYILSDIIL